jgi:DNA-binding NarL/FixJ family response regulator
MIRILLVDDQNIIREALKVLLEQERDFEIVGTADNGQAAIDKVESLQPDVLLIDILMPGMDGVTATQIICERFPETKVIVLSGHDDEEYLARALRAGAKGYLLKNTEGEDLANTIRSVYRGHGQLGPGLFEKMVARVTNVEVAIAEPAPASRDDEIPGFNLTEPEMALAFERFDGEVLLDMVDRALEQGVASHLLSHLGRYLKEHPTNLAALYLSGTLLNRAQARKKAAFQYLKFGFKEGMRQKLAREDLLLFYREGVLIQPEAAFNWLIQPGSPWNSEEGWSFLLQEASQRFGPDSTQYRTFLVLRQLRVVYTIGKACTSSLGPRVDNLKRGFERLDSVRKL